MPTATFLPGMGGIEVGLHNIAIRLQANGHRPIIIVPVQQYRELKEQDWKLPYEIVSFPPKVWGILRKWPAVGFFLLDNFYNYLQHKYMFDFWHCTTGYPIGVSFSHFANCKQHVPHLVRCAGEDIQIDKEIGYGVRLNPSIDRVLRKWLPQADNLIAISESVASEYKNISVNENKIIHITNGVDLDRFKKSIDKNKIRGKLNIPEDAFVFLSVGRNHPKKNMGSIMLAAKNLKEKTSLKFKLLIVGKDANLLKQFALELGISEDVLLLEGIGSTESNKNKIELPSQQLIEIYKSSDAFLFPSLIETFGIVLVEAMAAGLPVVTTDAPGCRDIIRNGKDGLCVNPKDAMALSDAMFKLINNNEECSKYALKSIERAKSFSWDLVVENYTKLYQKYI